MAKTWPMWAGLILGLAAIAVGLSHGGSDLDKWSAATRYTARVGFPLFILAYVARPLVDLTRSNWAKALLARRKWIGNGFALSHTVHLFAIVMLFRELASWPEPTLLISGSVAYALLYAMAATSNRAAMRMMGRWWKRLHRVGMHYIWLIFALGYAGRIFRDGTQVEGVVFTTLAISAAGTRLAAWQTGKARQKR